MPANFFTAADADSSAAVDAFMGESLELHPWLKGGGWSSDPGPDPSREVKGFTGTYGGAMGSQKMGGDRAGHDMEGALQTKDRVVTCDLRSWPPYARRGDRIKLLDQPGTPMIEIARISNDGINRAVVKCLTVESA